MFRNISEINKIGESNWSLMMALYSVSMVTDLGKRLVEAFPECFTDDPSKGPMPLSVLTKLAGEGVGNYEKRLLRKIFGQDLIEGVKSIEVEVSRREPRKGCLSWKAPVGEEYCIDKESESWIVVCNKRVLARRHIIVLVPSGAVDVTR